MSTLVHVVAAPLNASRFDRYTLSVQRLLVDPPIRHPLEWAAVQEALHAAPVEN